MAIKVESLTYKDTEYELIPPAPTSTERGGIIASAKTDDYTTEVKLGNDGKAYVPAVDLSSVSPYGGTLDGAFNIDADYGLTVGYYWCHITDSTTGVVPVKDYGILEVIRPDGKKSGVTIQRFTTYSNGNNVYTRMYCNAAWSAWRKLAMGDFLPLSGGTLTGGVEIKGGSKYLGFYDSGGARRLALWADNEGGNIRIDTPADYTNYWELDAYNGNLRVRDSSGNNTYTFKSYANGGRGGTIGNISLATSSSTLIGTASSGFNMTIDAKYHSLYLTGSVGSSGTMNLMFDMRYPRAGRSVSQSMAHGNSSINFTVSGNKLTSSGSSNGVSVYGIYYS